MSFLGMDTSAVRQLAAQMTQSASEIQQISQQLTVQLQNTQWVGPDRNQFENDWTGTHVQQLNIVMQALTDASQKANLNADQQDQASNS